MKKFKVTNVSNLATGSRGFFLDLSGRHIGVGKHIIVESNSVDTLPESLNIWAKKKWVSIHEVGTEEVLVAGMESDQAITPGSINPISELKDDDITNEEPNIDEAREANMGAALSGIEQGTEQMAPVKAKNAKITDAAAEERYSTDISPIPGEQPKELDGASKFTVKAGRQKHSGGVVKS